jgi:predicted small lipoprotein YifL
MTKALRVLFLLMLGAIALSGCGVRGPLEAPPGTPPEVTAKPGQPPPHKPFVLDPIIQ